MNEILKSTANNENTITSLEVAEMVGKEHSKLLKDIRRYSEQLVEAKIGLGDSKEAEKQMIYLINTELFSRNIFNLARIKLSDIWMKIYRKIIYAVITIKLIAG